MIIKTLFLFLIVVTSGCKETPDVDIGEKAGANDLSICDDETVEGISRKKFDSLSLEAFYLENSWRAKELGDKDLYKLAVNMVSRQTSDDVLSLINNEALLDALSKKVGLVVAKNGMDLNVLRDVDAERKSSRIQYYVGFYQHYVQSDPKEGLKLYLKVGTKEGCLEQMPDVISVLPAKTNWRKVDEIFPRDGRHVAVDCREALYQRWGEFEPADLMSYLVEHGEYGELMVQTLLMWRVKDAAAAGKWVEEVLANGRENPAWDTAQLYRLDLLVEEKRFEEAFALVYEMKRERNRGVSATETHAKWMKVDYKAAEEARKEYQRRFPVKK